MSVQEAIQTLTEASGAAEWKISFLHHSTIGWSFWAYDAPPDEDGYTTRSDYGAGTVDEFAAACARFKEDV